MVPSLRTMRRGSESAHRRVAGTVHTLGDLHRTARTYIYILLCQTRNKQSGSGDSLASHTSKSTRYHTMIEKNQYDDDLMHLERVQLLPRHQRENGER